MLKNKTVFSLVAVSTFRAMGQTALSAFLPLYLSLHLKLSAGVAGAYISLLYFSPACRRPPVGWISDRFGHKSLIAVFSFSSVAVIVAIPHLGSGPLLAVALAALGALLWALRPVIVTASDGSGAAKSHRQHRGGDLRSQHGCVFLAPLMAGVIADAYGLPAALLAIAVFPLLAAVVMLILFKPANVRK